MPEIQDRYRAFFLAKLTAKTDVSGVWHYDWTEQTFDQSTGLQVDANPRRSGTSAVSPALEANGVPIDLSVGPVYAFLKQKGIVAGQVYYEFVAPGGVTTDGGGCDWAAGLTADDCLEVSWVSATGRCSSLTGSAAIMESGDGTTWTGMLTLGGVDYTVTFTLGDCGVLCVTLTAPMGSGGTYTGVSGGCSGGVATFAFGGASLCTGEPGCDGAANNTLRIQIRQALCGWDGPGWYCVRDCGTDEACVPVELVEGDQYNFSLEICSGPYEDEAAADAVCGPLLAVCCVDPVPRRIQVRRQLSGPTGFPQGIPGPQDELCWLDYNAGASTPGVTTAWRGTDNTGYIGTLSCDVNQYWTWAGIFPGFYAEGGTSITPFGCPYIGLTFSFTSLGVNMPTTTITIVAFG